MQHHLTSAPTKGSLRYHPEVRLGEVVALSLGVKRVQEAKWIRGLFPQGKICVAASRQSAAIGNSVKVCGGLPARRYA